MNIFATELLAQLLIGGSNLNITIVNDVPPSGILQNNVGYELGDISSLDITFPPSAVGYICYISFRALSVFQPVIQGNVTDCLFTTEYLKYYIILGYFNGSVWTIDVQEYGKS